MPTQSVYAVSVFSDANKSSSLFSNRKPPSQSHRALTTSRNSSLSHTALMKNPMETANDSIHAGLTVEEKKMNHWMLGRVHLIIIHWKRKILCKRSLGSWGVLSRPIVLPSPACTRLSLSLSLSLSRSETQTSHPS